MKNSSVLFIALFFSITATAQYHPAKFSKSFRPMPLLESPAIIFPTSFAKAPNPVVINKSLLDDNIGVSQVYDMQSNASSMERVMAWHDGTVSAIWMQSNQAGYADCGTGYNYYDGSWSALPTTRVETIKTGSPNLCRWNGTGELILAHSATPNLVTNTRPMKGSGPWTQNLGPTGPVGSGGTPVTLLWPRAITNGSNYQNIHVIVMTMPTANGGIRYKGLDGALLYYRSTDGGVSWDKQAVQINGLDSLHYNGFRAETYTWIEPHGDTLAFLQGSAWNGTFLMKSYDNGETWTKQDIIVPYWAKNTSGTTPPFFGCDGTIAGAKDKYGVFHVAFGRMFARQYNGPEGFGRYWDPATDGLVYWNSTQPPMDSAWMTSLDSLDQHDRLIGYVASDAAGDSIVGFPWYNGGLSSYPNVTFDCLGDIIFFWSGLTVGNPDPTPYNYRHLMCNVWNFLLGHLGEMQDITKDIIYFGTEFSYPEVSKSMKYIANIMVSETSPQPGSHVASGSNSPPVPVHPVSLFFQEFDEQCYFGIQDKPGDEPFFIGQNFPNPSTGKTSFEIRMGKANRIIIEVINLTGQTLMTMDKGVVSSGTNTFTIDCSQLNPGIYFYTVKTDQVAVTRKLIVAN